MYEKRRLIKVISLFFEKIKSVSFSAALIGGITLFVMCLTVTYSVFSRYVLRNPIPELNEASQYMMLIMVFLGTAYTLWIEGHVKAELLINRLRPQIRDRLLLINYFFCLFWSIVLVWKTTEMTYQSFQMGFRSSGATGWYLFPFYIWVPLGCLLLCLVACSKIYYQAGRLKEK